MTPEERFEKNKNLVYFVAHNKASGYMADTNIQDDLIQEGFIALWKCCLNFDDSKGAAFSTYAIHAIENNMVNFAVRHAKRVSKLMSIQDPIFSGEKSGDFSYEQVLCDPHLDSAEIGILSQVEEIVKRIGGVSGVVVQKILEGYTQKEIGSTIGISQSTVSRIINKIREELKNGQ